MNEDVNINEKDGLMAIMNEKYKTMSKGQKLLARYTMENYPKVAFMTASKLGETVGVSESTVVRFANALGFSGYPKFQDALQELIKTKLTTVERVEMANRDYSSDSKILENVLKTDIDNIKETMDSLEQKSYEDAINLMISAKKVYVMGLRSSIYVAKYLGYYLNYILDDVVIIRMDMGEPIEQMMKLGPGDVLIAISFPRYSRKTIQVARFAKNRGAKVIALTDSNNAPTAKISDVVVTVRNNMVSFVDSLVPAFSVANALVIGVAMREKEDIMSYFNQLEAIWEKFEIYE
ncbi:MurR/RpiR family transcriptional regulator [Peptostreptococcus russellii]|uniref:Transcriptional regulator, RpiR family n=1 Tax=Peptostreptococcus russellii TaxID=215200 RepID=A0A1H8IKB2_9FIRM|nr:MurR/RpiR family transcriptional regulator [Peptostreptococcus russellii]MBC2577358.1 MurR/RpiR family transcriptional regulator [Peptostreptococcus russellii]SEN68327.1 transcriptional regulator, RpiR family [Peptostreptococcus russellii]